MAGVNNNGVRLGSSAADARNFLTLPQKPFIIDVQQVAWILGLTPQQVSILISKRALVPLGKPSKNGRKLFSSMDIMKLGEDMGWLNKAVLVIEGYWKERNNTSITKPEGL